jgi:hypothetical protein
MLAGVRSGGGVWKQEIRRRPPQVPGRRTFFRATSPDRVGSCVAAFTVGSRRTFHSLVLTLAQRGLAFVARLAVYRLILFGIK